MKISKHIKVATLIAMVLGLNLPAIYGEDPAQKGPQREDSVVLTKVAEVTAVSLETRQVTLMDELGKEVTLTVGPEVQRLGEVEVGDMLEVDYLLSVAFDLREPTAEEAANPLQIVEGEGRNSMDSAPGGAEVTVITAVCVIEGLDRPTETVTLMGPLGGLNVVRVADVNNLPKLRIGQTVVVTFTQATIVQLEKMD